MAVVKDAGGDWIPGDVYKSRTCFTKLAIGFVGDISFSAPTPVSLRYSVSFDTKSFLAEQMPLFYRNHHEVFFLLI